MKKRIIIFDTKSNIIQLVNATVWIIDSTFKIVSVGFTQVITIQNYEELKFDFFFVIILMLKSFFVYMKMHFIS